MRRAGISTKIGPWTVVALTAATLALGGCGRKGGLDLPPTGTGQPLADAAPAGETESQGGSANRGAALFAPAGGSDTAPAAAPRGGERGKRSFILDPLVGN